MSVAFLPTDKFTRQAVLGFSDSDAASPQAIELRGTGTAVSLSTKKVAFGNQSLGTTSAPQNITLKNAGNTPLHVIGLAIKKANAADFSQTNTCGASIAAGASCTIGVTFTPTGVGARTATLSINHDGGGSAQQVKLSGTGQ